MQQFNLYYHYELQSANEHMLKTPYFQLTGIINILTGYIKDIILYTNPPSKILHLSTIFCKATLKAYAELYQASKNERFAKQLTDESL